MKGKRLSDEQIIRILREVEAGISISDVCRKHNYSQQPFHRWKAKFGGDIERLPFAEPLGRAGFRGFHWSRRFVHTAGFDLSPVIQAGNDLVDFFLDGAQ